MLPGILFGNQTTISGRPCENRVHSKGTRSPLHDATDVLPQLDPTPVLDEITMAFHHSRVLTLAICLALLACKQRSTPVSVSKRRARKVISTSQVNPEPGAKLKDTRAGVEKGGIVKKEPVFSKTSFVKAVLSPLCGGLRVQSDKWLRSRKTQERYLFIADWLDANLDTELASVFPDPARKVIVILVEPSFVDYERIQGGLEPFAKAIGVEIRPACHSRLERQRLIESVREFSAQRNLSGTRVLVSFDATQSVISVRLEPGAHILGSAIAKEFGSLVSVWYEQAPKRQ